MIEDLHFTSFEQYSFRLSALKSAANRWKNNQYIDNQSSFSFSAVYSSIVFEYWILRPLNFFYTPTDQEQTDRPRDRATYINSVALVLKNKM